MSTLRAVITSFKNAPDLLLRVYENLRDRIADDVFGSRSNGDQRSLDEHRSTRDTG